MWTEQKENSQRTKYNLLCVSQRDFDENARMLVFYKVVFR